MIWSYPRGGVLPKSGELALDVGAYAAHMAALLGAHIIKTKLPTDHIEQKEAKPLYANTDWSKQSERVKHVVQSSFAGRRINVFSGGASKGEDAIFQDARDIRDGGGNGSIIGRNTFQRPRDEALAMLGVSSDSITRPGTMKAPYGTSSIALMREPMAAPNTTK